MRAGASSIATMVVGEVCAIKRSMQLSEGATNQKGNFSGHQPGRTFPFLRLPLLLTSLLAYFVVYIITNQNVLS
jgi:hypothetical protein